MIITIAVPSSLTQTNDTQSYYVEPLKKALGNTVDIEVIGFPMENKMTVGKAKTHLDSIIEASQGEYIYITNGEYFKALTGLRKTSPYYGYVVPCTVKGYEYIKIVLGLSYQALIYDPTQANKITLGLEAIINDIKGKSALGTNIIQNAYYPETIEDIELSLNSLVGKDKLTVDIETFGLRHTSAGIGTIAFGLSQESGIAFRVDLNRNQEEAKTIRALLRQWFINAYEAETTLIFHNATFDIKILIYNLFMDNDFDNEGLLQGLNYLTTYFDDTKIIAYLATNSCAGNNLGLKDLAQPFAGNYAIEEINDITKISVNELLQYNLIDCLSTWYVYDNYYPKMVVDDQEELYLTLMKNSLRLIIQMELTGMPMNDKRIQEVKQQLLEIESKQLGIINAHPTVILCTQVLQEEALVKRNAELKRKQLTIEDFKWLTFNPNSNNHLRKLFYEILNLPVIDYTDTKEYAVGAKTIEKLLNHTKQEDHKELIQAFLDYSKVKKIISDFIPSFENGILKSDGMRWLHGSFNLGGTVSGRLSSSKP